MEAPFGLELLKITPHKHHLEYFCFREGFLFRDGWIGGRIVEINRKIFIRYDHTKGMFRGLYKRGRRRGGQALELPAKFFQRIAGGIRLGNHDIIRRGQGLLFFPIGSGSGPDPCTAASDVAEEGLMLVIHQVGDVTRLVKNKVVWASMNSDPFGNPHGYHIRAG